MTQYYKKVDFRSRQDMTNFLKNHFRYHTMNSWNCSTSYANNIKVYNLGLDRETERILYEIIETDLFWNKVNRLLDDFAVKYNHHWQIGINGRSGGYFVLYHGRIEPTGHKSYCTACGQRNFQSIKENGNICGACGEAARVNFIHPPVQTVKYIGHSVDMENDFTDFTMYELRERVKLVQAFDKVTDDILTMAVGMCENCIVEDEIYYIPKTRKILVGKTAV
jgi:hypothetical protein